MLETMEGNAHHMNMLPTLVRNEAESRPVEHTFLGKRRILAKLGPSLYMSVAGGDLFNKICSLTNPDENGKFHRLVKISKEATPQLAEAVMLIYIVREEYSSLTQGQEEFRKRLLHLWSHPKVATLAKRPDMTLESWKQMFGLLEKSVSGQGQNHSATYSETTIHNLLVYLLGIESLVTYDVPTPSMNLIDRNVMQQHRVICLRA